MNKHTPTFLNLSQFRDKNFDKSEIASYEKLEAGNKCFKNGALLHGAKVQKGFTQKQFAEKSGTTKTFIFKIENNDKESILCTLELGLRDKVGRVIKVS